MSAILKNKTIKFAVFVVLALVFVAVGVFGAVLMIDSDKPKVDISYISGKLENACELTTQKLTYTGMYEITEGKIPFITKKGFVMVYTAQMRAGIELDDIDIEITDENVEIKIPHAHLQSVKIDPNTIKFYDEKNSLFNKSEKDDVTTAIAEAEKDAKKNAGYEELLKQADNYAVILIKSILEDSVGERGIKVTFK